MSQVQEATLPDRLPQTIADRTRWIYDRVAMVYPLSTFFFHARAHAAALDASGLEDGMHVLEIATGSGEMFRRLATANRHGVTVGLDLSPNMAARTYQRVRDEFPHSKLMCQAVDARYLPFREQSYDSVFCCYLLELLATEDIVRTLREVRRVLRPGGALTLVCIGQNTDVFNQLYKLCNKVAPAFWGRQVEERVPAVLESLGFRITTDEQVRQTGYPSRVLVAR